MTPEEIIAGNKTIAEFMGAKYKANLLCYIYPTDATPTRFSSSHWDLRAMEYNLSWDWIIPVVQKIKALPITEQEIEARQIYLENTDMRLWEEITRALACVNILMLWEKVIEFIEWHNKQKV